VRRVCPQESQCEGVCTVGESLEPVAIGRLERWVGDLAIKEGWSNIPYIEPKGFRIGIVGSGPAGMACAADMAKAGCEVIVYEPSTSLAASSSTASRTSACQLDRGRGNPQARAARRALRVQHAGRSAVHHRADGRRDGFHAVFIGTGAGYPSFMGIPGENLNGVLSANELLTRCNLMHAREFPNYDTRCSPASTWRSSAPATPLWTRCVSACGWEPRP